jgi:hypothetical protein
LDLIDDQGDGSCLGNAADLLEPGIGGRDDPALTLNDLEDHPGWQDDAAVRVIEQLFDIGTGSSMSCLAA